MSNTPRLLNVLSAIETQIQDEMRKRVLKEMILEAIDEAKQPLLTLSNFLSKYYPFSAKGNAHDYENIVLIAIELLTPAQLQDKFVELFSIIKECSFIGINLKKELASEEALYELRNILKTHSLKGLGKFVEAPEVTVEEIQVESFGKIYEEKAHTRLMELIMKTYECEKTELCFDDWLERQGLEHKDRTFKAI